MKKIIVIGMVLLLSVFFVMGCADKRVVRPVEQDSQQEQPPPVTAPKETAEQKGLVKPEERITEQQLAKIETTDELSKYKEESGLFKDIFFDYDKYEVQEDAKVVLKNISAWLLKNNSAKILVEGHCDDRGTNEYNLALGDRRSRAVRDYLVALGIGSSRIETISYGEEKPACKAATDECWAKNRRAHFVVLREAGK